VLFRSLCKNEGLLWWAACLAGLSAFAFHGRARASFLAGMAARGFGLGLVLYGTWFLACRRAGITNDLVANPDFAETAERIRPVFREMFLQLGKGRNLQLIVPALAIMVFFAQGPPFPRLHRVAVLCAAPCVYFLGIAAVYLWTPHDLSWHLSTSCERVLFGFSPMLLALAFFSAWSDHRPGPAAGRKGDLG